MYFFEGELRRWIGEGWSMPFPTLSNKGSIFKFRQRLISLIKQMQQIPEERAKAEEKIAAKAKGKATVVAKAPAALDLEPFCRERS